MKYLFTLILLSSLNSWCFGQESNFSTIITKAKNHSKFKVYTSDKKFLYHIKNHGLHVYANGNLSEAIQILNKKTGYHITKPIAIMLSQEENQVIVFSQGKITTFSRSTDTGLLELGEEKSF